MTDKVSMFEDFENRGACKQIAFDFCRSKNKITVRVDKNYFYYVLNQREYELLIISKHMLHNWN